ncbi:single-stranded-DNA-specific exonuclease RecJ [Alteromonas oceanisediminis]|uniref:single-stranded-DNA-specific exonuclease RecJ n=1 Tax=Alteromonas oceanisediminis TaxID=2836180 RepID=UPI001BD98C79|nr:single-stranded-DNA-specific exonuclease RecJ [Alteromonas oceanisediminis]MBT0585221.1 single-stranded-DNA-specific exonuclease RecJ [Alteromonas oceanisediminis]
MSCTIVRRQFHAPDKRPQWLRQLALHPVLENIYLNRGVESSESLDCSATNLANYAKMKGIDTAIDILIDALTTQSKILIVGDFDADGATSTALCLLALTEMGAKHVDHLVPNRFEYGYGLTPPLVDIAAERGAELIITVDNGISCIAGVAHAQSLGIKVIVTDHHLPGQQLPPANAIVNPNQADCGFPSKMLAGVGVAFYVLLALRAELQRRDWFANQQIPLPNLANYLDLVAVGTVADVVPLDQNNRVLVHQGLQRIRAGRCRPGLTALIDVAGREAKSLTSTDLGFVIGPRLNAAGRLDDMSLGIACLLAGDDSSARTLAGELDRLNHERKSIESSMQIEAQAAVESLQFNDAQLPLGLVVYEESFHAGVIGIVAGRLKDKFARPAIVFAEESDDTLKGSARSISGVHVRDILEQIHTQSPTLILKFGGHAMAAGLSIRKQDLALFTSAFAEALKPSQGEILQTGVVLSDGELSDEYLSIDFAKLLQYQSPWGQGFEEPIFDGTFTLVNQRIIGEKHLKLVLETPNGNHVDAIAFNVDTAIWPNLSAKLAKIAYKLSVNTFRGKSSVQLMVEALQPC